MFCDAPSETPQYPSREAPSHPSTWVCNSIASDRCLKAQEQVALSSDTGFLLTAPHIYRVAFNVLKRVLCDDQTTDTRWSFWIIPHDPYFNQTHQHSTFPRRTPLAATHDSGPSQPAAAFRHSSAARCVDFVLARAAALPADA